MMWHACHHAMMRIEPRFCHDTGSGSAGASAFGRLGGPHGHSLMRQLLTTEHSGMTRSHTLWQRCQRDAFGSV